MRTCTFAGARHAARQMKRQHVWDLGRFVHKPLPADLWVLAAASNYNLGCTVRLSPVSQSRSHAQSCVAAREACLVCVAEAAAHLLLPHRTCTTDSRTNLRQAHDRTKMRPWSQAGVHYAYARWSGIPSPKFSSPIRRNQHRQMTETQGRTGRRQKQDTKHRRKNTKTRNKEEDVFSHYEGPRTR